MFAKGNWAYDDVNTIFQFCKWADTETDFTKIYNEAQKVAKGKFVARALAGYLHEREEREK